MIIIQDLTFRDSVFYILAIVFSILAIIVILHMNNINLNSSDDDSSKKLMQTVTIETLQNNAPLDNVDLSVVNNKYSSFCKSHEGSSNILEDSCNKLTETNCNNVDCCVYLNGNKCVAGKKDGPTYKTEKNGDKINVDYYYYKGKCVGKCLN